MKIESVSLFILNYNGTALLGECLPGILAAAKKSRRKARVTVIDNHSSNGTTLNGKRLNPGEPQALRHGD